MEEIAEYIESLSFAKFSTDLVSASKNLILDSLCCSLLGKSAESTAPIFNYTLNQGGKKEALIWFSRVLASSLNASLVNGTSIHSYDLDDQYAFGALHPGSIVIPTAFAVGDSNGKTRPKELLTSIIAGYAVMIAIGEAFFAGPADRKYELSTSAQPNPICGVFASAAVAAYLLGLSRREIENSLAIAGSFAFGNREFMTGGGETKSFQQGKTAMCGIMSALLARDGLTGPKSIFEGQDGIFRIYFGNYKDPPMTKISSSSMLNVSVKRFPVIYTAQSAIEGLLKLREDNDFSADMIKHVTIKVPKRNAGRGIPLTKIGSGSVFPKIVAHMDMRYSLAIALIEGCVTIKHFSEHWLSDGFVRQLAQRIEIKIDEELNHYDRKVAYAPARVEVTTTSSAEYSILVENALGHPSRPFNTEQILEKFKIQRTALLPKFQSIARNVGSIEEYETVLEFSRSSLYGEA